MKAQDGLVIPPSGQRLWNGEPTANTCPFGQMISYAIIRYKRAIIRVNC